MLEMMVKRNQESDTQDLFTDNHRLPPPPQGQGIVRSQLKLFLALVSNAKL